MSHLRGSTHVPFSWEDMPGVSKINTQKCLTNVGCHDHLAVPESNPKSKSKPKELILSTTSHYEISEERVIIPPPPPCLFHKPPRRSFSKRFLWKVEEEDPFLEALKECTKSIVSDNGSKFYKFPVNCYVDSKKKKNSCAGTSWGVSLGRLFPKLKKSKASLSCKEVFGVEENNLVMKPSSNSGYHLPIPRERFQGLIKMQERLRD